jgi:hypothetical protein
MSIIFCGTLIFYDGQCHHPPLPPPTPAFSSKPEAPDSERDEASTGMVTPPNLSVTSATPDQLVEIEQLESAAGFAVQAVGKPIDLVAERGSTLFLPSSNNWAMYSICI